MTTKPHEALERAARARAESSSAFVVALHWRKKFRNTAAVLHLVRSLEMGLEAFGLFEGGRAPQSHDLRTLLRALSPDLQSQIIRDTGDPVEQFDANLDAVHRAFDEGRNAEAQEAQLADADIGFLERFARAVQRALFGHPSAAQKTGKGPAREASEDDHMAFPAGGARGARAPCLWRSRPS